MDASKKTVSAMTADDMKWSDAQKKKCLVSKSEQREGK